jgi:hypothetical protein
MDMKGGNRRLNEKKRLSSIALLLVDVCVNLSVFCYAKLGVVLNFRHPSMK